MRADLIGEGYAAALAELQDNVAPFDSATAMAIVERELGAPPADIFTHITPEPIASASLGQVRCRRGRGRGLDCDHVSCPCLPLLLRTSDTYQCSSAC